MTVTITVKKMSLREERIVDVRRVTTASHKRLTAHAATRILRREFPDIPEITKAFRSDEKGVFCCMHSLEPTEKCSFHYTWKRYYLSEERS